MGSVIGLAIAAAIAFLLEYIDDTVKTSEDVQRVLDLPTLGAIPKISSLSGKSGRGAKALTQTHEQTFSPFAEAYRTLRTNIQFSSLLMTNSSTTLLITSSAAGEGKSTTAANLALVMAQGGKQVILVDTDLRRPVLHTLFDTNNDTGLTNLLVDDNLELEEVLVDCGINNLRLLPSGPLPPNSADILGTPQMEARLTQLSRAADLVIFDSPPVLVVTDASILAKQIDSTLLVIEAGRTRRQVCQRSKETLEQIEAKIAGAILNRFNPKKDAGYGYGYGYNYYYSSKNGRTSQDEMKQQKVVNERRAER
jgi:capsular exopolysaccharide synthesis family protein